MKLEKRNKSGPAEPENESGPAEPEADMKPTGKKPVVEIGRASCRERV